MGDHKFVTGGEYYYGIVRKPAAVEEDQKEDTE